MSVNCPSQTNEMATNIIIVGIVFVNLFLMRLQTNWLELSAQKRFRFRI